MTKCIFLPILEGPCAKHDLHCSNVFFCKLLKVLAIESSYSMICAFEIFFLQILVLVKNTICTVQIFFFANLWRTLCKIFDWVQLFHDLRFWKCIFFANLGRSLCKTWFALLRKVFFANLGRSLCQLFQTTIISH